MNELNEEISCEKLVHKMIKNLPLGTKITIHDLYRKFPDKNRKLLSSAMSHLTAKGILENLKIRSLSEFKNENEWILRKVLVYKIISYEQKFQKPIEPLNFNQFPKNPKVPELTSNPPQKIYFKNAFLPTPSTRTEVEIIYSIAKNYYFLCDIPLYSTVVGDEFDYRFGRLLGQRLEKFDAKTDVLVCFGDQIAFGIAMYYLGIKFPKIKVAHWSTKNQSYTIREIGTKMFQ